MHNEITAGNDAVVGLVDLLSRAPTLRWTQHVVELEDSETRQLVLQPGCDIDLVVGDVSYGTFMIDEDYRRFDLEAVELNDDGYGGKLTPYVKLTCNVQPGSEPFTFYADRRNPFRMFAPMDATLHHRGADAYDEQTVRVVTPVAALPSAPQHGLLAAGEGPYRCQDVFTLGRINAMLQAWCAQIAGLPDVAVEYVPEGPAPAWLEMVAARAGETGKSTWMCSECLDRSMGIEPAAACVVRGGVSVPVCEFHIRPDEQAEPVN